MQRVGLRLLASFVPGLVAGGCVVHTYTPMSGLHRPVVVDPAAPNLAGLRLAVRCYPGPLVKPPDAAALCRKVGMLFEGQGASVATGVGGAGDDLDQEGAPLVPDLTVELRARQVHEGANPLSYAAMIASFTLVPATTSFTFEQEVVVRDGSGFLLATDRLQGNIRHWFGFGSWASNGLLDITVREKPDEVLGEGTAERALSADLYRQLSQTVFDASVAARVLSEQEVR